MSHHPASMVMTKIGGREYPLRSIPSCKTCQDPNRLFIENELIRGASYASIARALVDMPAGDLGHPNSEGISSHIERGHLPLGVATQRRMIERRAKEIGRSIQDSEENLADYVTVNQMIVSRGFERMQAGEINPDLGDVINASKFLHTVEQASGGDLDEQAWRDAMLAYMEVAAEFIPPERFAEYGQALSAHPVLRAMMAAASQPKALEAGDDDAEM